MRAVAIAPFIIRWGPGGWQEMLRRAARCTKCGRRGVELQPPHGTVPTPPMPIRRDVFFAGAPPYHTASTHILPASA
jgi:hypothetical protein